MELLKPFPPNSSPLTPIHFLERAATAYSDCPSIAYNTATTNTATWESTHRRCTQAASSLSSLGIKPGHVVSVLAPNIPAMYELHFAIPMAGAILNTINTRLDPRTLSVLLRHSATSLVLVDHHLLPLFLSSLSLFPPHTPRPLFILIDDEDEDNSAVLGVDHERYAGTYQALVDGGDSMFKWVKPRSEFDPIALNYTSGTTNNPKGVVLSHRGYFLLAIDTLVNWSVPQQPVYLWTLPMFHANGWSLTWGMAAVGATNVCLRRIDARSIYSAIDSHHVTHMCGAPVVLNMLANYPGAKPLPRHINFLTAGAPPPASVLYRAESLGFTVNHGYGLTETGGLVVTSTWKSKWNHLPSTEKAWLKARQGIGTLGMTEMSVVDPKTGRPVTRDGSTLGEVVLKGGSLMLGYLNDSNGTTRSMTENGLFRTGDMGVIHPDGFLEIKDRLKDIIISGGENISSVEVESVLYTHKAVNEAAVVALPDEYWGETPCAFVSLKGEYIGKVEEREVIEYCRERMAHYMVPKTVVFEAELPKTSTGKIQKFLLREVAKAMGPSSSKSTTPIKV